MPFLHIEILIIVLGFTSQEVPPTPGQPVKEPMFIPVAVGLLDSSGKDIPLTSVYHDGLLQALSSDGQEVFTTVLRVTKVRFCAALWLRMVFYMAMSMPC